MAYFIRTDVVKKHPHMLFIGDNGEIIGVSPGKNHEHSVDQIGPFPEIGINEVTYVLGPAPDGHTHYGREEIQLSEPKTNFVGKNDTDLKNILDSIFTSLQGYEADPRNDAVKSSDFRRGKQWPEEDVKNLEADGRAHFTLNITGGMIDSINGYWRSNKQSVVAKPIEKDDEYTADAATKLITRIFRNNKIDTIDSEVRSDQHVVGRGLWHIYIDDADDAFGDVKIEYIHWGNAYLGPHTDRNLRDLKLAVISSYMTPELARAKYPELKEKSNWIAAMMDADTMPLFTERVGEKQDNAFLSRHGYERSSNSKNYYDVVEDSVNVLSFWIKEEYAYTALVNTDLEVSIETKGWKQSDVDLAAKVPGFESFDRVGKHVREIVKAGEVILKNEINPFYGTYLPIVPAYGHKYGNDFYGKVRDMRDLNMDINKRRSQIIDFANRMLGAGWLFDDQTFGGDQLKKQNFLDSVSTSGFKAEIEDTTRPPIQVTPPPFPQGLISIETTSDDLLKRITNITHEFTGAQTGQLSGVAIKENKETSLVGNADFPENFTEAKRLVAEITLTVALNLWSVDHLFEYLTGVTEIRSPQDQILKMSLQTLKNSKFLRHDMVITESEHSPTRRNAALLNMFQMALAGIKVPQTMMIDYFDIPPEEKERWKEELRQEADREERLQRMKFEAQVGSAAIKSKQGG